MFVLCKEEGFRNIHTYIQSICITVCIFFHGMASLCMARHTSIWLCSIFFSSRLSSICLSFSHSSNPINPINHHPIHINSTTAWLCFRLHLTRLSFTFLVSSLTRLSFKFLSTFFFSFKPSKPDSFLSIFLSFFLLSSSADSSSSK